MLCFNLGFNDYTMKALIPFMIYFNSHFIDKECVKIESTFDCDFQTYLSNPEVPELAKKIYLNQDWNLSDDIRALALLDSLYTSNSDAKSFYFKVVTLSESKADGYFSEGLSFAAYKYVLNKTPDFSSYFDRQYCHTEADLSTWARLILGEFHIQFEDNQKRRIELENYCIKLNQNCSACSDNQKLTLGKFVKILLNS